MEIKTSATEQSPSFSLPLLLLIFNNLVTCFFTTFLNLSPTEQYIRKFMELKMLKFVFCLSIFVVPVDGEEEVVDADGDGVPGGGHVTSTGRGGGIIAMNRTLSQV